MIKVLFGFNRKAEFDQEEFERYWREEHAPIAAEIPGLRKYTISMALEPDSSRYDGTAQFYFDSRDALEEGLDSEAGRKAAADFSNFADTDDVLQVILEEHVHVEEA